jgi:DNA-binding GntR family transcriptional regulator
MAAQNKQDPAFFEECDGLMDRMAELISRERNYESSLEVGKIEHGFHYAIASGNKQLAKSVSDAMNQLRRLHYDSVRKSPWMHLTIGEHRGIVKAIENQAPAEARQLMQDHIAQGARRTIQVLFGETFLQRGARD